MENQDSGEAERQVTDAERLWKACADTLRAQVSDATWMAWFEGLVPISSDELTLTLASPSSVVKQRLEERYQNELDAAVTDAQGYPTKVVIDVRAIEVTPAAERAPEKLVEAVMADLSIPPPPPRPRRAAPTRSRFHLRRLRHR